MENYLKLLNLCKQVEENLQSLSIPYKKNVPVTINTRAKSRCGCCKKKGREFVIEISSFALDYCDEEIKDIIAHELIHTCRGCFNHGEKYKHYMNKVNTLGYKVSTIYKGDEKPPVELDPKYIAQCRKCGYKIFRMKKSKLISKHYLYKCPKCSGKFDILNVGK